MPSDRNPTGPDSEEEEATSHRISQTANLWNDPQGRIHIFGVQKNEDRIVTWEALVRCRGGDVVHACER
jgi:hypothetical protein